MGTSSRIVPILYIFHSSYLCISKRQLANKFNLNLMIMKTKSLNGRKYDEKPVGLFRCGNYIVAKIKRIYKP